VSTTRRGRCPVWVATALVVGLAAGGARAQTAAVSEPLPPAVELARNELIRQAEAASQEGDHDAAIGHARRALALRVTPSVQHFLAREYARLERPLEALAHALACERGAEADPALRSRDAILRGCRALGVWATAGVGRVVVEVGAAPAPGLAVRVGGAALPTALLGVPYAVAPGVVMVEMEAPGYTAQRVSVAVDAGRVVTVPVTLVPTTTPEPSPPPLAVAPLAVAPLAVAPLAVAPLAVAPLAVAPLAVAPLAVVSRPASRGPFLAVGAGLSVLALGGLAVAGVSYARGLSARDARDGLCASPCALEAPGYADAREADGRYRDRLEVATGALVVGVGLAVGAALWWGLARPASRRPTPIVLRVHGAGGVAGAAFVF
jgi:hypothetical protein